MFVSKANDDFLTAWPPNPRGVPLNRRPSLWLPRQGKKRRRAESRSGHRDDLFSFIFVLGFCPLKKRLLPPGKASLQGIQFLSSPACSLAPCCTY
jgi:hypothetical protein